MLFLFETFCPSKHLLHISHLDINELIDETTLQEALSAIIELPDDGKLHHKCTTEGEMVLIWDFEDFTPCSSVLKQNFKLVKTRDRFLNLKMFVQEQLSACHILYSKMWKLMFFVIKKTKF